MTRPSAESSELQCATRQHRTYRSPYSSRRRAHLRPRRVRSRARWRGPCVRVVLQVSILHPRKAWLGHTPRLSDAAGVVTIVCSRKGRHKRNRSRRLVHLCRLRAPVASCRPEVIEIRDRRSRPSELVSGIQRAWVGAQVWRPRDTHGMTVTSDGDDVMHRCSRWSRSRGASAPLGSSVPTRIRRAPIRGSRPSKLISGTHQHRARPLVPHPSNRVDRAAESDGVVPFDRHYRWTTHAGTLEIVNY